MKKKKRKERGHELIWLFKMEREDINSQEQMNKLMVGFKVCRGGCGKL